MQIQLCFMQSQDDDVDDDAEEEVAIIINNNMKLSCVRMILDC